MIYFILLIDDSCHDDLTNSRYNIIIVYYYNWYKNV